MSSFQSTPPTVPGWYWVRDPVTFVTYPAMVREAMKSEGDDVHRAHLFFDPQARAGRRTTEVGSVMWSKDPIDLPDSVDGFMLDAPLEEGWYPFANIARGDFAGMLLIRKQEDAYRQGGFGYKVMRWNETPGSVGRWAEDVSDLMFGPAMLPPGHDA